MKITLKDGKIYIDGEFDTTVNVNFDQEVWRSTPDGKRHSDAITVEGAELGDIKGMIFERSSHRHVNSIK